MRRSFQCALLTIACWCVAALTTPRQTLSEERQPVYLGRMLIGWDSADLPADPSLEQQIAAGKKQVAAEQDEDQWLDSNREVVGYYDQIAVKLIAASAQKPLFPISVHVSSEPIQNAFAMPGGQIVLYEKMFDTTDNESQLVSVIAHEIGHKLHNDFMVYWHDYKQGMDIDGPGGVLEQSVKIEAAADQTGARLMYAAGWDPNGMPELLKRFHKFGVMARHGAPDVRSSHPEEAKRAGLVEDLIATLPARQDLIEDSPRFQELKEKY